MAISVSQIRSGGGEIRGRHLFRGRVAIAIPLTLALLLCPALAVFGLSFHCGALLLLMFLVFLVLLVFLVFLLLLLFLLLPTSLSVGRLEKQTLRSITRSPCRKT